MYTQPKRDMPGHRAGVTAIVLILWLSAALAGCDGPPLGGFTHLVPTPTPTATPLPTVNVFSTFSGWRAAYMSDDDHLHAISLTDHSDLVGMATPGLDGDLTISTISAGAAPDGRAIAYYVDHTLTMLDLARHHAMTLHESVIVNLAWSPDSARLAVESDKLLLFDRASAKLSDITPANLTHPSVLGWRADGALILQTADPNYTVVTLWAEDIQTKAVRQITQIPVGPQIGPFKITIAPNGAACVLYTWRHQDNPFTPLVETVDLTTGALHPLPNITKATGADFDNLIAAWRPDGTQLALERGGNPVNSVWILDLAHDTAVHATDGVHPVGWAPDGSGLVLSTVEFSSQYAPHELAMLPLPVTAPGTLTPLTDHAVMFPFLGFVRGG